ncbi:MAG: hypothetical protein M3Z36_05525 [Acidobacteriota bacterium]|nr:hypothetical protein [Acidobacteriota bacterium]
MARILLIGFDEAIANQIGKLIQQENHIDDRRAMDLRAFDTVAADLILACGDDRRCMEMLAVSKKRKRSIPFVVVTRLPETARWLDALEAGAADYWAGPFERTQFRWLLDSALPRTHSAAA